MSRLLRSTASLVFASAASQAMSACPDGDWWPVEREAPEAQYVFVGTSIAEWPDPGVEGRGEWIAGTFYRLRLVFASSCMGRLYAYAKGNSGVLRESQHVLAQATQARAQR
jgi:hypothetical protein